MGKLFLTPDASFNQFWAHYPKRFAKQDALKAWFDLDPSQELVERILTALDWQCEQDSWTKEGGQFIPYPASWIRAGRYDDEPVVIVKQKPKATHGSYKLYVPLKDRVG